MAFRDLIRHNFWLKGFSAVLATLIWFALSQSDVEVKTNPLLPGANERDITRAVAVLKSPAEQRLFRVDPAQVTVRLGGDRRLLGQLNPEDVDVYVNVGSLTDPQGSLRVEVYVRGVPSKAVAVVAIVPAHVDVRPISSNP